MRGISVVVLGLLVGGCSPKAGPAATPGAEGSAASALVAKLGSVEVKTDVVEAGAVRLVNGEFVQPAAPGSAEEIIVRLLDKAAEGDVTGDGAAEVAAIVGSSSGGTGVFIDLAMFAMETGGPRHLTSARLGDRVRVIAVSVDRGIVTVELDQHSETDPMCCPTQRAVRTFRLEGDALVQVSATPAPHVAP